MKLASLNNGDLDGQLCLVSRDLKWITVVSDIANHLQEALDNWASLYPALSLRYQQLNEQQLTDVHPFDSQQCLSPLPRSYQWLDGSAYVNHVELVRKARGATMPEHFWHDPLMYQGASDSFLSPCDDIPLVNSAWGLDFEAEVAVVTNRVPQGVNANLAGDYIVLLMLVNDCSLRNLIPDELAKGFGFIHGKPSSSFSPVAVTVDELGDHWRDNKVHLPLSSYYNDVLFGCPHAGVDMTFNFAELVAHAATTRRLTAGTIIGGGTVSNRDASVGSSCLAEKRMLEKVNGGPVMTNFMSEGDHIKIEMLDGNGCSVFGAIDQKVVSCK